MRFLSCLSACLLSACIVYAAPPTVGQYEIRKRTSTGFESYGVTITNGQAFGLTAGVPDAITVDGGGGGSGTVTSVGLSLPGIFSVTGSPVTSSGTLAASLATQSANRVWAGPATGTAAAPTFRALVADDLPDLSSVYQPLSAKLTAFSALADSAGVLFNNGSGSLFYLGTSSGGNGASDQGKIVRFDGGAGGILSVTDNLIVKSSTDAIKQATLYPNALGFRRGLVDYCFLNMASIPGAYTYDLPSASGTLALTDGNITGTAAGLSSTLDVTSGGTGQTSFTNGQLLIGNTTGNTLTKATLTAGTGISITNGGGSITIAATASGGTVTSVAASVPSFLSVSGSPITGAGTLAITYSGTALPVANGGTGLTALGTGIATALGVNIGSAGAPILFNGDAGTPSAIVLTNATGTAAGLSVGNATSATNATTANGLSTTGSPVSTAAALAPSAGKVLTATGATTATWQTPSSGGKVAQVVFTSDGTAKTTTATIPGDNTIPQNTEGTEYTELATTITPTNASSLLRVEAKINISATSALTIIVAAFKDSGANALQTAAVTIQSTGITNSVVIRFQIAAGSTSAQTFKIRTGSTSAGTSSINASGTTALFGGTFASSMSVTEILP